MDNGSSWGTIEHFTLSIIHFTLFILYKSLAKNSGLPANGKVTQGGVST